MLAGQFFPVFFPQILSNLYSPIRSSYVLLSSTFSTSHHHLFSPSLHLIFTIHTWFCHRCLSLIHRILLFFEKKKQQLLDKYYIQRNIMTITPASEYVSEQPERSFSQGAESGYDSPGSSGGERSPEIYFSRSHLKYLNAQLKKLEPEGENYSLLLSLDSSYTNNWLRGSPMVHDYPPWTPPNHRLRSDRSRDPRHAIPHQRRHRS